MDDKQALALVVAAQAGDEDAQRAVALHVYNKYLGRVRRITADPVIELADMQATFFEGCMRAVMIADGRGDPLYHIGQRGIWNVQSELRAFERAWAHRSSLTPRLSEDGLYENPADAVPDAEAERAFDRAEDQILARDRIRMVTTAPLKRRERQAVEIIMSGAVGDPHEMGFNKRLAGEMGVSPQRASQIIQSIRTKVE